MSVYVSYFFAKADSTSWGIGSWDAKKAPCNSDDIKELQKQIGNSLCIFDGGVTIISWQEFKKPKPERK